MTKLSARLATFLLVALMILGFTAAPILAAGDKGFSDVPKSEWFYGYVTMLHDEGIVHGYGSTGEFRPMNKLTREHAAKMIARAAGLPYQGKKANFPDVDKDGEMSPYIAAMVDQGAIQGFPDGRFQPEDTISRGHAAKMVQLAFGLKASTLPVSFTDLPSHDPVVSKAIRILASNGIVKGYENAKNFKPDQPITRSQMAKLLCIAMVTSAVEEAETSLARDVIARAQGMVDGLPDDQDQATRAFLQERLDALKEVEPDPGDPDPSLEKHTVTFKLNDKGTAKEWVYSVNHGDTITGPSLRFSQQDIWSEWHIGSLEGAEWDRNAPVTSDLTLYGQITRKIDEGTIGPIVTVHTVTFKLNDKGTAKEWVYSVNHGDTITGPPLRFSQQDIWSEWHIGSLEGAEWDRNAPVKSDLTLYGKITRKIDGGTIGPIVTVHTVTFKLNDKGTAKEWVYSVNHGDTIKGPPLMFSQQDVWSEWHIGSLEGAEWDRNAPVKSDLTLYGQITRKIDDGAIGPIDSLGPFK